jgi:uncharacterized protein with HEPN domain
MRDDRARLRDILEAIERIGRYTVDDPDEFEKNELVQNWVIHHVLVIGEAANGLSENLRAATPQIPWSAIIGMRHVLVHHYFDVDLDVVRMVLTRDLPILRPQIIALLERMD